MRGWQANIKRTCAQPVEIRAMPENEIPPAARVDIYLRNSVLGSSILSVLSVKSHGSERQKFFRHSELEILNYAINLCLFIMLYFYIFFKNT